jgi:hypothetical protein
MIPEIVVQQAIAFGPKVLLGLTWLGATFIIYKYKNPSSNVNKVEVWSCRPQLRKIKRINDQDKEMKF